MNVQAALKTQYHAVLAMLKDAIEQCPDELWTDRDEPIAFWRVAYHTLFFAHFYLQKDEHSFSRWEHHRKDCQRLERKPRPPHEQATACRPYTKAELLEYWQLCDGMIDAGVDQLDLDAPECGFPWYPLPKLDHQIVNIRHIQHHAALLAGRLRRAAGTDISWVGRV